MHFKFITRGLVFITKRKLFIEHLRFLHLSRTIPFIRSPKYSTNSYNTHSKRPNYSYEYPIVTNKLINPVNV